MEMVECKNIIKESMSMGLVKNTRKNNWKKKSTSM
jgi:hypothetical protein